MGHGAGLWRGVTVMVSSGFPAHRFHRTHMPNDMCDSCAGHAYHCMHVSSVIPHQTCAMAIDDNQYELL